LIVKKVILRVPDISCEHCEHAITEALTPIAGVQRVAVDIEGKEVAVDYDDSAVDLDQLKDVLQEEDYPVESVTGG
jgi:copper chaperone CopZ